MARFRVAGRKPADLANPVLLGKQSEIKGIAESYGVELDGIKVIDPMESPDLKLYAERLYEKRKRKGITQDGALKRVQDNTYFGLMMLEMGACEALLSGVNSDYHTFSDNII